MNHGPFGLPPMVFSIGVLTVWLIGIPALSMVIGRKKRKAKLAATAASYAAQQQPGAHPWGDLIGDWEFKSAARWIGVVVGVVLSIGLITLPLSLVHMRDLGLNSADMTEQLLIAGVSAAVGITVAAYCLWRPTRAAQLCHVDGNLFITMARGDRPFPLDFRHYRYVRMHVTQSRYGWNHPGMLVFDRDSPPGVGTLLSSILFPRCDEGRIVMFYASWTVEGAMTNRDRLDDFFIDTCRRAGREPHFRRRWLSMGRRAWDATLG